MGRGIQRRRPRLLPSRITLRILAVNILPLAALVAGLLYHGEYRDGLIESELSALQVHADMVAAAIGESARIEVGSRPRIVPNTARQMVRRLASTTGTRARLYDDDGALIADSRVRSGPGSTVEIEPLPPPETGEEALDISTSGLLEIYDTALRWLSSERHLGTYHEGKTETAFDYGEAKLALSGNRRRAVRFDPGGGLMLSAAVPVQRYKRVLGAVMLSKGSGTINATLTQVRVTVIEIFIIVLAVTIALSLYLASTISRPIRRLSQAATQVRQGRSRQYVIPTFSNRQDEIGELARSLNEMTEALWLRMDAIESFAADVAHEIKNPLTSLHSAVETAAKIQDPAKQRQLMAIIIEDVKRLDRLISDISDASRLDAELSRAEQEAIDMTALLSTLVDTYNIEISTGGGTEMTSRLTLEVEGQNPLIVNAMEGRLVQVFRNLIANAQSFSPPGGEITIRATSENGMVCIEVDDQGPGIPTGNEEAVFARFYSERPEGERFGTHSGLGLSISRQIAEAHNGTIIASNRVGHDGTVVGSRFIMRLPPVNGVNVR
jgi:two-component system sensor histidine kinase ChvG